MRKQTFRLTAPDAESVLLVGDFTGWREKAIAMKPGTGGEWSASVELAPGSHNYLFIVDGQWSEDPECDLRVPNPYGGQNMVRQVT